MSTLTIARARLAASAVEVHVSCGAHEPVADRYSDAEFCRHCGIELTPATPGLFEATFAYRNGDIDSDEFDALVEAAYASDATWEPTKKAGVANHACCRSGSCHNRKHYNAPARKDRGRK